MNAKVVRQLIDSGRQLHAAGNLEQAERVYQQVLSIRAAQPDAVHLLGVIACQRQQFDQGLQLISRAIASSPRVSAFHNSLGNALHGLGRFAESIAAFRQACTLDPKNLEAMNNLAMSLDDCELHSESLECFDRLIQARNDVPEWHVNRGSAQMNAGEMENAIASFRQAIALRPSFAAAHAKLSAALLHTGNFSEGLDEAEWRFRVGLICEPKSRSPRWDGTPLAGRTLLIHAEQGLGDNIQFIRYATSIEKQGGRVIVQCPPTLERLLRRVEGVDEVAIIDQSTPKHDVHCSMLSLPLVFRTRLETIPNRVPYLFAPDDSAATWSRRLLANSTGAKKRIGLVWAGNAAHANDRRRSCAPNHFNALAGLTKFDFYRLQLPSALPGPDSLALIDHTAHLADMSDTAGLISNLDLVIAVDTAAAHLAGAMGKPVWLLLAFSSEWRWLDHRKDSPWYPTARLFRQSTPGDWPHLLQRVREALKTF